jgi:hypothetical protein
MAVAVGGVGAGIIVYHYSSPERVIAMAETQALDTLYSAQHKTRSLEAPGIAVQFLSR